jgi:hypothetical protein
LVVRILVCRTAHPGIVKIHLENRCQTVGKSKTDAGEGRTIPLNSDLRESIHQYAVWYRERFAETRAEWYVFPFGSPRPSDPTRPVTTLKTSWTNVRKRAGVVGRWHDNRHTLITELAETGAGDQTIMDIAGHVSKQMLSHYSHIRTQAKRDALETVARRRRSAEEELRQEGEAIPTLLRVLKESPYKSPYSLVEMWVRRGWVLLVSLRFYLAPQVGLESSIKRIFNNMQVSG